MTRINVFQYKFQLTVTYLPIFFEMANLTVLELSVNLTDIFENDEVGTQRVENGGIWNRLDVSTIEGHNEAQQGLASCQLNEVGEEGNETKKLAGTHISYWLMRMRAAHLRREPKLYGNTTVPTKLNINTKSI